VAPAVRISPGVEQKLELLGQAAQYDLTCACGKTQGRTRDGLGRWIYPAVLPNGRKTPLLKVLQQGGCERDCFYCAQRCGGEAALGNAAAGEGTGRPPTAEPSFTPEELAGIFIALRRQQRVAGLFLSSALRGGAVATMDRMLATAEILRRRYRFTGYLHLKLVPGCAPDQVERAMQLATRVSVNLEAPSAAHLARIAPGKDFERQLLGPLRQVALAQAQGRFARGGQTTQFVVGAGAESDREIVGATAELYRRWRLARAYFSAFQPLNGTPLQARAPAPLMREHRLYQVDFLLRKYGFGFEEVPFGPDGQLSLETDPKTLWARTHPERFPVEVNTAEPAVLMRVPGIGPKAAQRVLEARRRTKIRSLEALRGVGAVAASAAPFILLDGKSPAPRQERLLFE